jgi:hypothetical protein
MSVADDIKALTKQLLPTGRAFRLKGWGDALNKAIAGSELALYEDATSILDSLMPDTDRFDADDCTNWERILGVATNAGNTLPERRAAIYRKMSNPGENPAKGHYLTMQEQLQLAGFSVYVHENMFPTYPDGWESVSPSSLYGTANLVPVQYGQSQYGQRQYGYFYNNKIANSIYQSVDNSFQLGGEYNSTFFIGGQTLGTYANVPASREIEFRQLVLTLKQTQAIALIFINYT